MLVLQVVFLIKLLVNFFGSDFGGRFLFTTKKASSCTMFVPISVHDVSIYFKGKPTESAVFKTFMHNYEHEYYEVKW